MYISGHGIVLYILILTSIFICLDRGWIFLSLLLCILREMVEASLAYNSDSEYLVELLNNIQSMFQKILECIALRLRRQQEEGIQVLFSFDVSQLDCFFVVVLGREAPM